LSKIQHKIKKGGEGGKRGERRGEREEKELFI
jgi:hypothetical protein